MRCEAPMATHDGSSISAQGQPNDTQNNHTDEASSILALVSLLLRPPDPNNIPRERHTRKPSQRVQDLIDGRAVHSNRHNDLYWLVVFRHPWNDC